MVKNYLEALWELKCIYVTLIVSSAGRVVLRIVKDSTKEDGQFLHNCAQASPGKLAENLPLEFLPKG